MHLISQLKIALSELDIQNRYTVSSYPTFLGRGAYGTVVEAVDQRTGRRVAVKHICGATISRSPGEATRILRELRINAHLRYENHIVTLLDAMGVSSDGSVLMVFEMGICDLYKIAKSCPSSSAYPFDMIGLVFDVASALHTVHSSGVIHRDLKLSNLILMQNHRVALADFGISGPNVTKGGGGREAGAAPPVMTSYVQSRGQRAPELLYRRLEGELKRFQGHDEGLCKQFARVNTYFMERMGSELKKMSETPYDESIDIWSFGCILAELVLRESPFEESHNFSVLGKIVWLRRDKGDGCRLRDRLATNLACESPYNRDAMVDLILWMLSIEPTERPSARQILDYLERVWGGGSAPPAPPNGDLSGSCSAPTTGDLSGSCSAYPGAPPPPPRRRQINNNNITGGRAPLDISRSNLPQTVDGIVAALDSECKHLYLKGFAF